MSLGYFPKLLPLIALSICAMFASAQAQTSPSYSVYVTQATTLHVPMEFKNRDGQVDSTATVVIPVSDTYICDGTTNHVLYGDTINCTVFNGDFPFSFQCILDAEHSLLRNLRYYSSGPTSTLSGGGSYYDTLTIDSLPVFQSFNGGFIAAPQLVQAHSNCFATRDSTSAGFDLSGSGHSSEDVEDTISIQLTPVLLGIADLKSKAAGFECFEANHSLKISLPFSLETLSDKRYFIYDLLGRSVMSGKLQKQVTYIPEQLVSGMYIVAINGQSEKLIVGAAR